jgi:PKD repeat protein
MINQAHELAHNFGANHVNNPKAILNPMILGDNTLWDDTTIAAILGHKHSRVCLSTCNQGPTAEFQVTADSPCSDMQRFTDVSRGDPTSWLWTFGDGEGSTEKNPAHRYSKAGTYTARLTAANAVGADTASVGDIKVKPYAAPYTTGAASCTPAALTLKATGPGTLKWYESLSGGAKLGEGPSFQTPTLTASKVYYVESGDPDFPIRRMGPASNAIGDGQYFVANSDRRLYFDVSRPALLKTVKVYASGAGPRTIEVLDQSDARIATRTVQVPAGESRIALDFELPPGHDYAIKYAGNPDSLNLYRNSSGASFPYRSADSLIVVTRSDAVPSDSTTQSGYYYYFYDWEVQERGCASVRVPVAAAISCDPIATLPGTVAPVLLRIGTGVFRYAGESDVPGVVEFRLRSLDGRDLRRKSERIRPGAFAVDLDLAGLPANLYLLEVRHAGFRTLEKVIGF